MRTPGTLLTPSISRQRRGECPRTSQCGPNYPISELRAAIMPPFRTRLTQRPRQRRHGALFRNRSHNERAEFNGSTRSGNSTWPEQAPDLGPRSNTAGTSGRARFSSQEQAGGQNVPNVRLFVTGGPRHRHATRTAQYRIRHPGEGSPCAITHTGGPDNPGARPRHAPRTSLRRRTPRPAADPYLGADHWQDASLRRAATRTHRTRTHRLLGRRPLRASRDPRGPWYDGHHLHPI